MGRVATTQNPDGSWVYEYEQDTQPHPSGIPCARDSKGVPVSEAGRLLEAANATSADADLGPAAEPGANALAPGVEPKTKKKEK